MSHNISAEAQPRIASYYHSAAATISGPVMDASGYDRVLFIYMFGTAGGAATFNGGISKSTTSNGTFTAVTGASFATNTFLLTTGYSNRCAFIDCPVDPANPFMKCVDTIATSTIECSVAALMYRGTHANPWTMTGNAAGGMVVAPVGLGYVRV